MKLRWRRSAPVGVPCSVALFPQYIRLWVHTQNMVFGTLLTVLGTRLRGTQTQDGCLIKVRPFKTDHRLLKKVRSIIGDRPSVSPSSPPHFSELGRIGTLGTPPRSLVCRRVPLLVPLPAVVTTRILS